MPRGGPLSWQNQWRCTNCFGSFSYGWSQNNCQCQSASVDDGKSTASSVLTLGFCSCQRGKARRCALWVAHGRRQENQTNRSRFTSESVATCRGYVNVQVTNPPGLSAVTVAAGTIQLSRVRLGTRGARRRGISGRLAEQRPCKWDQGPGGGRQRLHLSLSHSPPSPPLPSQSLALDLAITIVLALALALVLALSLALSLSLALALSLCLSLSLSLPIPNDDTATCISAHTPIFSQCCSVNMFFGAKPALHDGPHTPLHLGRRWRWHRLRRRVSRLELGLVRDLGATQAAPCTGTGLHACARARACVRACACMRPPVRPCVSASVRPCVRASVRPRIRASVRLSVRPCVRASVHPYVHASVRPCVDACVHVWDAFMIWQAEWMIPQARIRNVYQEGRYADAAQVQSIKGELFLEQGGDICP